MTPSQIIPIPLAAGLDEGTDPKQLPPGFLKVIENGVWTKAKRVEKRYGTFGYPITGIELEFGEPVNVGVLKHVWSRENELAATDGSNLYSYSKAVSKWKKVDKLVPALGVTWRSLIAQEADCGAFDIDANDKYLAVTWLSQRATGNEAWVAVFDRETEAVLMPPTLVDTGVFATSLRVVLLTNFAYVFHTFTAGNDLQFTSIDLATFEIGTSAALRTDVSATKLRIDAVRNGVEVTIAYKDTANNLYLRSYSDVTDLTAGGAETANAIVVTLADACYPILDATPGEHLYVKYINETAKEHKLAVHDPTTLAQTLAPITVYTSGASRLASYDGSVVRLDATHCVYVVHEIPSSGTSNARSVRTLRVSSTGDIDLTSTRVTNWAEPISRAFVIDGRAYLVMRTFRYNDGRLMQNTSFVAEIGTALDNDLIAEWPHRLVGTIAPRECAIIASVCRAPVVDGKGYTAVGVHTQAAFVTNALVNVPRAAVLATFSPEQPDPWRSALLGRTLAIIAGSLHVYDGRILADALFLESPSIDSATAGGGGSMAAGTYQYVFVYEWRDNATGLLHRSIASDVKSVTVGANGSVAFVLQCASTSGKWDAESASPVYLVPYRTRVGGTTFYRMAMDGPSPQNVIMNVATARTVAWTDTRSDANIDGSNTALNTRPVLYTTGGVLDDVQPPSAIALAMHGGRLWLLAGDQRTIWYSKKWTDDAGVFPGFHENLRIVLEDEAVALASLDDKLVIFGRDKIWIVTGEGPAVDGSGSTLSEPILVQSDAGCVDPRSVIAFPGGVMFQSARGLYLLSRGLEVTWAGRAVQDQLASFPTIVAATLVPHRAQVRFACVNEDEDEGRVLVWDYANGNWSVFIMLGGVPITSSVYHDGQWHWTTPSVAGKYAFRDDETTHLDDGAWVTLAFELADLSSAGPAGWQHVRRVSLVGERVTDHDLTVSFAFNHRDTYAQSYLFDSEKVATNKDCPTMRVGCQDGASPRCKALRVRVTDATPTGAGPPVVGTGKGGLFSAIGLEIVPQSGLARHGARHSKV